MDARESVIDNASKRYSRPYLQRITERWRLPDPLAAVRDFRNDARLEIWVGLPVQSAWHGVYAVITLVERGAGRRCGVCICLVRVDVIGDNRVELSALIHQPVQVGRGADSRIDLVEGRVEGIVSAALPPNEVNDDRLVVRPLAELPHQRQGAVD